MSSNQALPSAGVKWLVLSFAAVGLLSVLLAIGNWTISTAQREHRERSLLAAEAVLPHGQVLKMDRWL